MKNINRFDYAQLKNHFTAFHLGILSKDELTSIIAAYQYINGIKPVYGAVEEFEV